jgi:hypothetical protein
LQTISGLEEVPGILTKMAQRSNENKKRERETAELLHSNDIVDVCNCSVLLFHSLDVQMIHSFKIVELNVIEGCAVFNTY